MTDDDAPLEELIGLEPPPDEEAWEAYLLWAMDRLGADGTTSVDMKTLALLEKALGRQVPFEVGLLLVIGVPDSDGWHRWGADPAAQLLDWNRNLQIANRPIDASPLLPLYRNHAVPVGLAEGQETASSNPVLRIEGDRVRIAGRDLAAWLTAEFDVPLPMWPDTAPRYFPFWSDLAQLA